MQIWLSQTLRTLIYRVSWLDKYREKPWMDRSYKDMKFFYRYDLKRFVIEISF